MHNTTFSQWVDHNGIEFSNMQVFSQYFSSSEMSKPHAYLIILVIILLQIPFTDTTITAKANCQLPTAPEKTAAETYSIAIYDESFSIHDEYFYRAIAWSSYHNYIFSIFFFSLLHVCSNLMMESDLTSFRIFTYRYILALE